MLLNKLIMGKSFVNTVIKFEDFRGQGSQKCFELEGKKGQETGDNYLIRSFMMCNTRQIVFGWWIQGQREWRVMWHAWRIRGFGLENVKRREEKRRDHLQDLGLDNTK